MLKQSWTDGIHNLVETLTCRVRVLSLPHLREVSNELCDANMGVMETLQSLIDTGLIVGEVWRVPTCSIGDEPLFEWSPNQPAPDCFALEAKVQGRWHQSEDAVPVVAATHVAARMFGSSGGGIGGICVMKIESSTTTHWNADSDCCPCTTHRTAGSFGSSRKQIAPLLRFCSRKSTNSPNRFSSFKKRHGFYPRFCRAVCVSPAHLRLLRPDLCRSGRGN